MWYEIDKKIDWLYLKANEVILVGGVSVLSSVKRNWAEITTQYTFYSFFIMVDRLGKNIYDFIIHLLDHVHVWFFESQALQNVFLKQKYTFRKLIGCDILIDE